MARRRPRTRRRLSAAIGLGIAGGMRTGLPAAAIALRDGQPGSRLRRLGIVLGAAGELVFDKLPIMPSRTDAPGLLARFASSGAVGRRCAGPVGGLLAGATALGSAFVTHNARRDLGRKTGLPDPVIAVAEDAIAIAIARLATRRPLDPTTIVQDANAPEPLSAAATARTPASGRSRSTRRSAGRRRRPGSRRCRRSHR